MLVDSHCHLDFPDLSGEIEQLLQRMRENEVVHAVCIGVTLENWARVRALAEANDQISMTVGVHPDEAGAREPGVQELVELAGTAKVVAIGETGLDYYRLTGNLEWQRERFRTHIRAARACRKPLVVHTRSASADTIEIMRTERADEVGGVMHCFTETMDVANAALDLGFHISFSGIVTFRNAVALKEVARRVPLNRILVETDAPYLAPVPHRGKRNEPAFVRHVAEHVAELRGMSLEALAAATTENFQRLFGLRLQT
ncbi:MAG: TatD family hydrolase [Burkholderiales bacterium]|nr:TatD family hydrolase [Burkholderiales bacterium]